MNAIDVGVLFDQGAQDYDRTRRQYIPCFDDFYGTALQLLPADRAGLRMLDLGAGTGLFAGLARPLLPNARFTLCDISENMLAQARKRFAHDDNVDYLIANYVDEALPIGEFDVILSALSIHHTPHAQLPFVFANVFNALKAGGIFINADQSLGSTPHNEALYEQQWLAGVCAKGCTDADVAIAQERKKADKTATMELQLTWMRDAGFAHVDCWYKNYRFAVYSGSAPLPRETF